MPRQKARNHIRSLSPVGANNPARVRVYFLHEQVARNWRFVALGLDALQRRRSAHVGGCDLVLPPDGETPMKQRR